MFEIVKPGLKHLASYKAALETGWSPDNLRTAVAQEQLIEIAKDPVRFVDLMEDVEAKGGPVTLPDGSQVPRLPGVRRWMWDGEFCGSIGFRWQKGTARLPPHVLGHIGYATVPWKRRLGYATRALGLLLKEIHVFDLPYVEITALPENEASQKVILANGGVLVEKFRTLDVYGGVEDLRFKIDLGVAK